ncbi:MAG: hypothetical protein COA79_05725 [Planctomycetota bacterium]|nr:MAG: hypothetical protein COA79_05725 [Planctomycetota bacterium]
MADIIEIKKRGDRLPIIKTERLILRDIELKDISEEYVSWLNNESITKYLEIRFVPQTKAVVEKYILSKLSDTVNSKHFGVYDNDGKRLIGTVTLSIINYKHSFAEVSFVIGHKDAQGKGFATEALSAIVHYSFYDLKISKLIAGYYEGHIGSSNVLKKNGFVVEGIFKKKLINHDGIRVDQIVVGLLSKDV